MRTIRRQVYARDRRLALLQLRQGKCRCAVTVRTSAGCPLRGCASPTRRTFRPVVARISRKPYLDSSNFRLLHCTIYYFALQRKLHGLSTGFPLAGGDLGGDLRGDLATTWQLFGGGARDGTPGHRKGQCAPKPDVPPPGLRIAAHFCADYSSYSLRTPPFHVHAIVTKPSDSRHFLR
jgi:hypothetical protein